MYKIGIEQIKPENIIKPEIISLIVSARITPKTVPATVPITPITVPCTIKILVIIDGDAPKVRKIAMSDFCQSRP